MEDQTKPTLTLNPDEEKKTDILQGTMPVRQTVQPVVQAQSEYSAGSIDESMLSSDEKEMVEQFALPVIFPEFAQHDRRCRVVVCPVKCDGSLQVAGGGP